MDQTPCAPASDDVVLSRATDGSLRYMLSSSGGTPQIICATYEDAIARADRFARAQHLDVWRTDNNRTFRRILECRPGRSS
jgi:hypothetical protein